MISIEEAIKRFIESKGQPSLIVGPRGYKFPLQDILRGMRDTLLLTLPEEVWEHDKLYMENGMSRMVVFLEMHHPENWKSGRQILIHIENWLMQQPEYWTDNPIIAATRKTLHQAFSEAEP